VTIVSLFSNTSTSPRARRRRGCRSRGSEVLGIALEADAGHVAQRLGHRIRTGVVDDDHL